MTALRIAKGLGQRVAVLDTERGSASKYAELGFDTQELTSFHPERYIAAIHEAEQAGYDVLVIDSLSHAWSGKDGALELVDRVSKRNQGGNNFAAWRDVTPLQNALIDAILGAGLHVICTLRAKEDYSLEKDASGRSQVVKKGLQPIQREGLSYEFDVVGDINMNHDLVISKTRCPALTDQVYPMAGPEIAGILNAWLTDGAPPPPDLVAECDALAKQLRQSHGYTPEDWRQDCQAAGGSLNPAKFAREQQAALLERLQALAATEPAAEDEDPETEPEGAPVATEPADATATTDRPREEPISDDTLRRIEALTADLGAAGVGKVKLSLLKTKTVGALPLTSLSESQGQALLKALAKSGSMATEASTPDPYANE
jgi:hypothetical protein